MSASWPANVRPLSVATTVAQEGVAIGDVGTVAGLNPEVHRSQLRIALRLAAAEEGRLLHVPGLGWHGWDGCRWALSVVKCFGPTVFTNFGPRGAAADRIWGPGWVHPV